MYFSSSVLISRRQRRTPLFFAVASLIFLNVSCGGDGSTLTGAGTANGTNGTTVLAGTGSIPLYDASTQQLTLPQLQIGSLILADVKMSLTSKGTWAIASRGASRTATAADRPAATLTATSGVADLTNPQIDAMLTVSRLHAGPRVFSSVAIKLSGNQWAFGSAPQEIKTLHAEDFKSNTAIAADESHHVVLNSNPTNGVQSVPMQLSARPYKFCMAAQAEGADSMTLLDAFKQTVFALRAGDDCITINPTSGRYTMEHRYGGSGKNRTVFMHNEANKAVAASAAGPVTTSVSKTDTNALQRVALGPASASGAPNSIAAVTGAPAPLAAAGSGLTSPGQEYWLVRSPLFDDYRKKNGRNLYLSNSRPDSDPCRGSMSFADPGELTVSKNSLLKVEKDGFTGTPVALGPNISCTFPDFTYAALIGNYEGPYETFINVTNITPVQNYRYTFLDLDYSFIFFSMPGGGVCNYDPCQNYIFPIKLAVKSQQNNSFQIFPEFISGFSTTAPKADYFSFPYIVASDNSLVHSSPTDKSPGFIVDARYFPSGLTVPVNPDVGEYALFSGLNCSGSALVTSSPFTSTNYSAFPDFQGRFQSMLLGQYTRAVVTDKTGATAQFNQLSCIPISASNNAARQGIPDGFVVPPDTVVIVGPRNFFPPFDYPTESFPTLYPLLITPVVDTVTIVIRTNICESCNLAGGDFSNSDLSGVKLSGANLANAVMANIDLSRADLRATNLQGARMSGSNLEAANLCNAQLNAPTTGGIAARLGRAHLKNTNLSGTVLDGVDFFEASLYSSFSASSGALVCQQSACSSYVEPTCAGAANVSMNNADFGSAYLANVDFSGVKGTRVNFSNATLFGVSFAGAKLNINGTEGTGTKFNNARLQGSDFSSAEVPYADFTGAQMDLGSQCVQTLLGAGFLQFPGATVPAGSSGTSCTLGKQTAPFCVQSNFNKPSPGYPVTDCTNTCADGSVNGPQKPLLGTCTTTASCAPSSWGTTSATSSASSPGGFPTSSCNGALQLCDGFTNPANTCW